MLRDRVEQLLNNPGSDQTITPGAATDGKRTFAAAFGDGKDAYYTIDGGDMWEVGVLRVAVGPPETLSRNEVIANSLGTTARLNFTGPAVIYNHLPAARTVHTGDLAAQAAAGNATVTSLAAALDAENRTRGENDAALNQYIASVDTKLGQVNTAIRRDYADADAAFYRRVTDEQRATPFLQTALISGAWPGQNFDPVVETVFFDTPLPTGGRKVVATITARIYAGGTPGAFGTGILFRVYPLYQTGQFIVPTQPTMDLAVISGTTNSESHTFVLEFPQNVPPGALLRCTAQRLSGNASCVVEKYTCNGFCIVGGP